MERYEFISRDSSSPLHHIDKYQVTYPDGTVTQKDRQVPKRVGKTQRERKIR